MATIDICDICQSSEAVARLYFCYDRQSNGAPSSEDVGETFDLCLHHRVEVLEAAMNKLMKQYNIHKYEKNKISIDLIKYIIARREKRLEGK